MVRKYLVYSIIHGKLAFYVFSNYVHNWVSFEIGSSMSSFFDYKQNERFAR